MARFLHDLVENLILLVLNLILQAAEMGQKPAGIQALLDGGLYIAEKQNILDEKKPRLPKERRGS